MYHACTSFPGGSVVKNPDANVGDSDLILCWEESLEKENGQPTSILAWKNQWVEGYSPWSHEDSGYDLSTERTHTHHAVIVFDLYQQSHSNKFNQ